MKPATGTVAVMNSLFIWNDLLVPLIFLQGRSSRTIPMAIYSFVGDFSSNWPMMFAAIVLSSLPLILLFAFTQKHFVKGIVGGAIKS
jgi:raffinose/stachyose/melibiose transport system permease protein